MVPPDNEAIAVSPHRVAHQVLFEEFTIPLITHLVDNPLLDISDERSEPCLAHPLGKRIRRPFA